ncbi:MAG TPA: tetratricopeptide repeat protein [Acidobacteriaceae bacterium]
MLVRRSICAVLALALLPCALRGQKPDPDALLARAVAAQTRGDYPAAIREYRELLAARPNSIEGRVNLGAALAHSGEFDGAIEQYRAALAAMPAATPEDLRRNVQLNLALAFHKKGDLAAARAQLLPLHLAAPGDARIATLLGDAQSRLGDPGAAVAMMAPMAAANQQDLDFDFVYGSALIRSGQRRDGAAVVEKVAELGHSADAYMLAGSTLLELNEYERARFDLEQALLMDAKLPGLWSLVGVARDRTGANQEAEPAFREALKQNPGDFNANLYLGTTLLKARKLDEAAVYLNKAIALDPASSMARYEGAMLKSTAGDAAGAAAELEKVTAAEPDWLDPHVQLATLYYRLHKPEQGAQQRAIVDRLTATQQANGPTRP